MILYHMTPAENVERINKNGMLSAVQLGASTLAGRRKPFLTRTNRGNVWDIRRMIPFALSLDNEALKRVPRPVLITYDFDIDKDEYIFSDNVSTSPKSYYYAAFDQSKADPRKSEILLTVLDKARFKIHQAPHLARYSVSPLPARVEIPAMNDRLGRIYKSVYAFFRGLEFGVHGRGVSGYTFDGDRSLKFMSARNASGWHIYIRPPEQYEPYFVLIDDVSKGVADNMMLRYANYMVIRSSWANWQVWIRGKGPMTIAEKKELIAKYGGDAKAHPNRRWGRAPGYTNRKPEHARDGKFPWVSLEVCKF